MKRILIIICWVAFTTFSACNLSGKQGSGAITTRSFPLSYFDHVDVSGAFEIRIRQVSDYAVTVEGDNNLLEYVVARMEGRTLDISLRDGVRIAPTQKMILYISAPEIKKVETSAACDMKVSAPRLQTDYLDLDMSGASKAKIDQINARKIDVEVSGATSVVFKGSTDVLDIDASGASKVNCYELKAQDVSVDISGAGITKVNASRNLDVDISGSGKVLYKGNPENIRKEVSGAATLRPAK